MSHFLWKIGGEAGFGILTTGTVFSKIATRRGYYIYDYIQYPSLIRGGHNTYDVGFSPDPVTSLKEDVDMLVCLNKATYELHKDRLGEKSLVIYDDGEFDYEGTGVKIKVPFKKILSDLKGQILMKNTIALGASLALLGAGLEDLNDLLVTQFGRKGDDIVAFNKAFAQAGYDHVLTNYPQSVRQVLAKREMTSQLVISGNETFALAASVADCRMYVAYPMTPASSVLTVLAAWQEKTGMVVRHAEDEISVINTALGSSMAGVRSAVGTSGGGFALMVESLSFAGIAEIPIVVFVSQRPGPATGMPTWTEQGDLLFAVHAGHGEFPKIVLAPGDNNEMFDLTLKAFDLADIYQTPVMVMSDMLLSESHRSLSIEHVEKSFKEYKADYGKVEKTKSGMEYLRYLVTDDGISPRLHPGTLGTFYQNNSYEHIENGHTSEDAAVRIAQVNKRTRKMNSYLAAHFDGPLVIGNIDEAEAVFVTWGSSKGAVLDAIQHLKEKNKKCALMHFTHLFPLDRQKVASCFKSGMRYILVENNGTGQFGKLLAMECAVHLDEKILRYDGRPLNGRDIANYLLNAEYVNNTGI